MFYPYSAAAYPDRQEYYAAMRYTRGDDGAWEKADDFAGRYAASVALLAAVLQADMPGTAPPPVPPNGGFGGGGGFFSGGGFRRNTAPLEGAPGPLLPEAWAFLARLLNTLPPTPPLVADALATFLEMVRASATLRAAHLISIAHVRADA